MGKCTGETATHLRTYSLPFWAPPSNFVCVWCQVCDLAQALRDGVLLCQLLNNLLPQAVNLREINLRPQMSQVTHMRMEKQFPICFHSDQEALIVS